VTRVTSIYVNWTDRRETEGIPELVGLGTIAWISFHHLCVSRCGTATEISVEGRVGKTTNHRVKTTTNRNGWYCGRARVVDSPASVPNK
jgi:hypothetical protein